MANRSVEEILRRARIRHAENVKKNPNRPDDATINRINREKFPTAVDFRAIGRGGQGGNWYDAQGRLVGRSRHEDELIEPIEARKTMPARSDPGYRASKNRGTASGNPRARMQQQGGMYGSRPSMQQQRPQQQSFRPGAWRGGMQGGGMPMPQIRPGGGGFGGGMQPGGGMMQMPQIGGGMPPGGGGGMQPGGGMQMPQIGGGMPPGGGGMQGGMQMPQINYGGAPPPGPGGMQPVGGGMQMPQIQPGGGGGGLGGGMQTGDPGQQMAMLRMLLSRIGGGQGTGGQYGLGMM
jgi:hypothetical protein